MYRPNNWTNGAIDCLRGPLAIEAAGSLHGEDNLHADIDGFRQQLSIAEHDGEFSAYRSNGAFNFMSAPRISAATMAEAPAVIRARP